MQHPRLLFRFALLIVLSLFLHSCTSFRTFRRYKSAAAAKQDNSLAEIDLSMLRIDSSPKKDDGQSIWKLAGRGQAEIIGDLNWRYPDNDKFLKILNKTYLKKDDKADPLDLTSNDLTMVFTIIKKRDYEHLGDCCTPFSPADRIEYLHYELTLADTTIPLRFRKWNRYTTEYGSVDIGDVSFSRGLSGTAGIGDSSVLFSPYLSVTGSLNDTESQHVKYRFLQLNGQITQDNTQLKIEEEGQREIDLTGNVVANVTCQFRGNPITLYSFGSLTDENNNWNPVSRVEINLRPALVPDVDVHTNAIHATLALTYVYRHVRNSSGQRSYYEWDDRVQYYKGTYSKDVTLYRKRQIFPLFAYIGLRGQEDPVRFPDASRFEIKDNLPNVLPTTLYFQTPDDANAFIDWLYNVPVAAVDINSPIVIGGHTFSYPDNLGHNIPITKHFINANRGMFIALDEFYR